MPETVETGTPVETVKPVTDISEIEKRKTCAAIFNDISKAVPVDPACKAHGITKPTLIRWVKILGLEGPYNAAKGEGQAVRASYIHKKKVTEPKTSSTAKPEASGAAAIFRIASEKGTDVIEVKDKPKVISKDEPKESQKDNQKMVWIALVGGAVILLFLYWNRQRQQSQETARQMAQELDRVKRQAARPVEPDEMSEAELQKTINEYNKAFGLS